MGLGMVSHCGSLTGRKLLNSGTDTIKVFDGEGKWVHSLDNAGGFKECVGVAISGGDVYVLSRQGVNGIHKY